jgi:hypothetical protein
MLTPCLPHSKICISYRTYEMAAVYVNQAPVVYPDCSVFFVLPMKVCYRKLNSHFYYKRDECCFSIVNFLKLRSNISTYVIFICTLYLGVMRLIIVCYLQLYILYMRYDIDHFSLSSSLHSIWSYEINHCLLSSPSHSI